MAYIRLTLASRCLNGATDVSVFFPDDPKAPIGSGMAPRKPGVIPGDAVDKSRRYQVLWLMHGGGDDYTAWPLDAMVQRACGSEQLIVVMPTIRDLPGVARNADYLSYVTEELPELIGFLFPISRRREDNFIAGLSYGGYFAYRCALTHPQNYACVGSFSSPLDVKEDVRRHHVGQTAFSSPDSIDGTDRDVLGMATKRKEQGVDLPRMFQTCGTEDFTWDFNVVARDHFRALGLDHTWIQRPGVHNFEFWDGALRQYLQWLPLRHGYFKEGN